MKGTFQEFERGIKRYCQHFNRSRDEAILDIAMILLFDEKAANDTKLDERGDIVITCELCRDDAWWQANYDGVWQAAQWWHCGPFGLDCSEPS